MRTRFILLILLLCAGFARADDFATRMVEATFKVYHKDSTATGFFVRPPAGLGLPDKQLVLVTASHVFEKMKTDQAIIVLRRPQTDGTFARRDFEVKVREDKRPLWTKHTEQDVAVLPISLPDDSNVHPIDFDALADEAVLRGRPVHVGSELLVLGYPARVEANSAAFPICRHASLASHPLIPIKAHQRFLIDFSTFAGDSGGPVFVADPRHKAQNDEGPPLVLGIVINLLRHDEKLDSEFEERMVHHPLNLATIVQAQYVRETILQLKAKPATGPATRPATRVGAE